MEWRITQRSAPRLFYGGYLTNSNPFNAACGALIGIVFMILLLRYIGLQPWVKLGISTASAIAVYGFTFFIGTWAIAAWNPAHYLLGLGLSGLSLGSLWLAGYQVLQLLTDLKTLPGTFFKGADLTNATFENTVLMHTDLGPEP